MDDEGSFERSGLNDKGDAARHLISTCWIFISTITAIGDNPLLIRAGRQVINWGEATFLLGGNSVFSPIDVPAIRRPAPKSKTRCCRSKRFMPPLQ